MIKFSTVNSRLSLILRPQNLNNMECAEKQKAIKNNHHLLLIPLVFTTFVVLTKTH